MRTLPLAGSDEFSQREIHVSLNRRERLADGLHHGSEHFDGKRFSGRNQF